MASKQPEKAPPKKRRRDRGEDSVYQRSDNHRWIVEIRMGYKPSGRPDIKRLSEKGYPDDTREHKKLNTEAKARLLARRDDLKAQLRKGVPVAGGVQTVASYLHHWLENNVKSSKRRTTYDSYESVCRVHIIPILGRKHLTKLTPLDVEEMMGKMLESGRASGWLQQEALAAKGTSTIVIGNKVRLSRSQNLHQDARVDSKVTTIIHAGTLVTIVGGPKQEGHRLWWQVRTPGVSPTTVKNARGILRKALNDAMRADLVARNVVTLTDMPKQETYIPNPLAQNEIPRFLTAAKGHRLETLWLTFLTLGLRAGEAFGLRWEDIDLDHGELRVQFQIQRVGNLKQPEFVPPKTERSRQPIPLPAPLIESLREHRQRQETEAMLAGSRWQGDEWQRLVFCTTIGTPLDPSNVIRQYRELLASADLDTNRRVHDLRHTCGTMLARLGVHPRQAQEILRHSQIQTTLAIYTSVGDDSLRAAVDQLGALMVTGEDS